VKAKRIGTKKDVTRTTVSRAGKKKAGEETWVVKRDGHSSSMTTSKGTLKVMDNAVGKYAGALKRLADK
jgi:hypothetical protein